ncbi:hypothetical protein JYT84_00370 [bacterium AH-315-M10]|nr:hypothetical protein [bacterium AH-315-M10]
MGVAAMSIGIILYLFAGKERDPFISPGPLSSAHGSLSSDCQRCHSAAGTLSTEWLKTAADSHRDLTDSRLCLDCHQLGKMAFSPHDQQPASLRPITKRLQGLARSESPMLLRLASRIPPIRESASNKIACAGCHQEHRGVAHSIKQMGVQRCQSCHVNQFRSLAQGHPEFSRYPYPRRTRIAFDHVSHKSVHFLKNKSNFACLSCHQPDDAGRYMNVRSFKASCADCHMKDILGTTMTEPTIAFFRLPSIDTDNIKSIGRWPVDPSDESPVTSFMEFLLPPVKTFALPEDISDLEDADERAKAGAYRYVWSIKRLLATLAGDPKGRAKLLGSILKQTPYDGDVELLFPEMQVEAVRGAAHRWLPELKKALGHHDANKQVKRHEEEEADSKEAMTIKRAGWYINGDDFSIRYRATRHFDHFIQRWLQEMGRLSGASPAARKLFNALRENDKRCSKCHSVDLAQDSSLRINWTGARPSTKHRRFTKYAHAPHFSLPELRTCTSCHVLRPTSTSSKSDRSSTNEMKYTGSFRDITRSQCAGCHKAGGADDTCTICHNYHVGQSVGPFRKNRGRR